MYQAQRGVKKATRSKPKGATKKAMQQVAQTEIVKASEPKSVFTNLDEIPNTTTGSSTLSSLSLITRGTAGNQRVGQQVKPTKFVLKAWFRPRGLKSEAEQFDSAFYSRVIIVRQKPNARIVSGTPAEIQINNSEFFKTGGGTTAGVGTDFKDIFYKFNTNLGTVIYDKKFFISGNQNLNNTREINFTYRFPKSAKMHWTDASAYPHEMITMFIINRKADDDVDAQPKTVEYSGHAELYYRDL